MDTNLRLSKSCCEPANDGDDDASCSPLLVQSIDEETKRRKKNKNYSKERFVLHKVQLFASKLQQKFQTAELLLLKFPFRCEKRIKRRDFLERQP